MKIVVYDGAGLFSAPRVWWMLKTFGARDVVILDGGAPLWRAQGRPWDDVPVQRRKAVFTPRLDHAAIASIADVTQALASGDAQVVDARPADRFTGATPEPRPGVRSGHMPGSLNLPFSEVVADGRLKGPDAVRAALAQAGIDAARPVITSCGSGVSAAILALALDSIGAPVKAIYDGSWAQWGSRDDKPVATGPARRD
jgi:thiosulfate/3-mercaptopyruvate sulfurtransferase